VLEFDTLASVKFEILFPTAYVNNPDDPGEEPKPVQITEIQNYLSEMTGKYVGYTVANPYGHPPVAVDTRVNPWSRISGRCLLFATI
jgi:hypothetical protein